MRKLFYLIVLIFLLGMGHSFANDFTFQYEVPYFSVPNYCTNEDVDCTGTVHYHNKWDDFLHAVMALKCVGLISGDDYIAHVNIHQSLWSGKYSEITTIPVISKGKNPNMLLTIKNHINLNANGEKTVSKSEGIIYCIGDLKE